MEKPGAGAGPGYETGAEAEAGSGSGSGSGAGAGAGAGPGRVGTLTAEQEGKLKELWTSLLKVFGQVDDDDDDDTAGGAAAAAAAPAAARKKKKKLFKKKIDGEDKYSQTADFKAALSGQTPTELRAAFWAMVKADDPDGLLLRFLRARKWDAGNALVMLVGTMQWRGKQMHVEEIVRGGEEGAVQRADGEFLKQLRLGKSYLHGRDREGRPVNIVSARLHRAAEQSEATMERYTVYVMETARMLLRDPVDTAAIVFDMSDFSLSNMDYAPVKFMIKCFEAHYPESLGVCLVHRAPWVFQGVWSIIKGWLDPVVASKIHFSNSVEELAKYIPQEHIIAQLGGPEAWTYEYPEPVPGENAAMEDTATRDALLQARRGLVEGFEALTRRWLAGEEVAGERRRQAQRLRDEYWRLDPYIRARTYLDRTGVLQGERVEYYPPQDPSQDPSQETRYWEKE